MESKNLLTEEEYNALESMCDDYDFDEYSPIMERLEHTDYPIGTLFLNHKPYIKSLAEVSMLKVTLSDRYKHSAIDVFEVHEFGQLINSDYKRFEYPRFKGYIVDNLFVCIDSNFTASKFDSYLFSLQVNPLFIYGRKHRKIS